MLNSAAHLGAVPWVRESPAVAAARAMANRPTQEKSGPRGRRTLSRSALICGAYIAFGAVVWAAYDDLGSHVRRDQPPLVSANSTPVKTMAGPPATSDGNAAEVPAATVRLDRSPQADGPDIEPIPDRAVETPAVTPATVAATRPRPRCPAARPRCCARHRDYPARRPCYHARHRDYPARRRHYRARHCRRRARRPRDHGRHCRWRARRPRPNHGYALDAGSGGAGRPPERGAGRGRARGAGRVDARLGRGAGAGAGRRAGARGGRRPASGTPVGAGSTGRGALADDGCAAAGVQAGRPGCGRCAERFALHSQIRSGGSRSRHDDPAAAGPEAREQRRRGAEAFESGCLRRGYERASPLPGRLRRPPRPGARPGRRPVLLVAFERAVVFGLPTGDPCHQRRRPRRQPGPRRLQRQVRSSRRKRSGRHRQRHRERRWPLDWRHHGCRRQLSFGR